MTRLAHGIEVHPRVGGGDPVEIGDKRRVTGPSPRGRGRRCQYSPRKGERRSIPAWAGATCGCAPTRSRPRVHPRVGGGDFDPGTEYRAIEGPSPRGRGRQIAAAKDIILAGSIPAWAGATTLGPTA